MYSLQQPGSFHIYKEESLVAQNRAAKCKAILIPSQGLVRLIRSCRGNIKEIPRVEGGISQVLEHGAVELIGPAARRCVDHVWRVTVFRAHVRRFHLEFLQGIYVRLYQRAAGLHFRDEGSVE